MAPPALSEATTSLCSSVPAQMGSGTASLTSPSSSLVREVELEEIFELLGELGRGAWGVVVRARRRGADGRGTGEEVAIKQIRRDAVKHDTRRYVHSEVSNHSRLRHPHVVQFKEVHLSAEHLCIVMELVNDGSLFKLVRDSQRLSEQLARWFFQQLVLAVDYCHRMGVYNRDIKLENILLQKFSNTPWPLLKVCDFGYSKSDERSLAKSTVGTVTYMPPEVLQTASQDLAYSGGMADIWCCGVCLYIMLVGRYPFINPTQRLLQGQLSPGEVMRVLDRMNRQDFGLPAELGLSPACADLLRLLLQPDPARRISVEGILRHEWFRVDLPPAALSMNDKYLAEAAQRRPRQTEDEIRAVLNAACC